MAKTSCTTEKGEKTSGVTTSKTTQPGEATSTTPQDVMAETSNTTQEGEETSGVTTSKTTQPGEATSKSTVVVVVELKCGMTAVEGAKAVIKACAGIHDCVPKIVLPKNCDTPKVLASPSDWDLDWN